MMGVSWVLECCKCKKAEEILFELEHDEAAEALEAAFYLYKVSDIGQPENATKIIAWIEKHRDHGGIRFTGYP